MTKKVLIVSTYRIRCGIASFTEVIRSQLKGDFTIDVFPLDQFVLGGKGGRVDKAGDRLIDEIIAKSKEYDLVNLQWEPGFFGATQGQILRRFEKLVKGVGNLVVTAHTILPAPLPLRIGSLVRAHKEGGWARVGSTFFGKEGYYPRRTYDILRRAQLAKTVHFITHTRRDARFLEKVIGFENVHNHPLSHMDPDWVDAVQPSADQEAVRLKAAYGHDAVFVGVFGFLSAYKGFDTALKAIRLLPDNYHLMIYGGMHHVTIKEKVPLDPYLSKLLRLVEPTDEQLLRLTSLASRLLRRAQDDTSSAALQELYAETRPIKERVHFMGSPDDFQFAVAMATVDICLFPYMEVGQSGSGPVSQALELGKRTVTTNNKAFAEVNKYFPNKLNFFDVGNHIQLAQIIEAIAKEPAPTTSDLAYTYKTQRDFYRNIFASV